MWSRTTSTSCSGYDLPGLSDDDVALEVKDRVLTVSGERNAEEKKGGRGLLPRRAGLRPLLPLAEPHRGIDVDKVTAEFDNGVLEVRIPKPEERKSHRIQIGKGSVEGEATEQ